MIKELLNEFMEDYLIWEMKFNYWKEEAERLNR